MLDLLLEYKWAILIGAEVFFWACAAAFFLVRYWFELDRLSYLFLALIVAEEVLVDLFVLGMGVFDYKRAGQVTSYQIVVAVFLLYALTFGRQDFKRLDAYLKRKVAQWKGRAPPPATTSSQPPGSRDWDHAREERRGFYEHMLIFIGGQTILLAIGESWIAALLVGEAPEQVSGLMQVSRIWCVVLAVDAIWSLSYTLFPRRVKG